MILGEPENRHDPRRVFLIGAVNELWKIVQIIAEEDRTQIVMMTRRERDVANAVGIFPRLGASEEEADELPPYFSQQDAGWHVTATYLINASGGLWDASSGLMFPLDEEE